MTDEEDMAREELSISSIIAAGRMSQLEALRLKQGAAAGRESLTFTHFPRLTVEIGRMATTGNTGSMEEWTRFLGAVDAALNEAARNASEDTQRSDSEATPTQDDVDALVTAGQNPISSQRILGFALFPNDMAIEAAITPFITPFQKG